MANQFLIKETMAAMRSLSAAEIMALQNGTYEGVQLLGYYEKGDTPAPIIYHDVDLLNQPDPGPDDGGSIIKAGSIKLQHKFISEVYFEYFGIKADGSDVSEDMLKVFEYGSDNHLTIKGTADKTYTMDNVVLRDKSKFKVDSKAMFRRMDNMPAYPEDVDMTAATSTFRFENCSEFQVINMCFDGNGQNNNCLTTGTVKGSYNWGNYLQEFRHCLYLENCGSAIFDNIFIKNPSGDGIYSKGPLTKDIYFKSIRGESLDTNGNIFPIGRNLLSIIEGTNYAIDLISSNGIGHATMPSGGNIEPNPLNGVPGGQKVTTVNVGYLYNRSFGMSGLCITTKNLQGEAIKNVHINNAYLENTRDTSTVRTLVITGATNVSIDNIYIKSAPNSYAVHVGIAGDEKPVYNLNIKNAIIDTCLYGMMLDNLTGGSIKANVINCYENMYRLYGVDGVDFDITGSFSPNIQTQDIKNFCTYFNLKSGKRIINCTFSGDFSFAKVGSGGQRAINANNLDPNQIVNCEINGLNLDGWPAANKIVGSLLKIKTKNIGRNLERGIAADRPTGDLRAGNWFYNTIANSYSYYNGNTWTDLFSSSYSTNNAQSYVIPDTDGIKYIEQNYTVGEAIIRVESSSVNKKGTIFFIKNNTNQNVRLVAGAGVTIQSSSNHNGVIMTKMNDVLMLVCSGINTWRYVLLSSENATLTKKGLVNQSASSADSAPLPSTTYTQSEVSGILTELRDLKTKLRIAGILAP